MIRLPKWLRREPAIAPEIHRLVEEHELSKVSRAIERADAVTKLASLRSGLAILEAQVALEVLRQQRQRGNWNA